MVCGLLDQAGQRRAESGSQLVRDLQASEQAGAAAQATDWLPLMTMVTYPTFRYPPRHPAPEVRLACGARPPDR